MIQTADLPPPSFRLNLPADCRACRRDYIEYPDDLLLSTTAAAAALRVLPPTKRPYVRFIT